MSGTHLFAITVALLCHSASAAASSDRSAPHDASGVIFDLADAQPAPSLDWLRSGGRNNAIDFEGQPFTQATTGFDASGFGGVREVGFPNVFVVGEDDQPAGAHMRTGAETRLSAQTRPLGGGLAELAVIHETVDNSDIFPAGAAANGNPLNVLAFEFGQTNAIDEPGGAPIPLMNASLDEIKVVDTQYVIFVDGEPAVSLTIFSQIGNFDSLAGFAAVSNAAGADISGHGLVWTIQIPAPSGAALLGVTSLLCVERRRRG